jgi:signal transduction histidine kinase
MNPSAGWFLDHIHPADLALVQEGLAPAESRALLELEYRLFHRNGAYIWVLDRGVLIRDHSGEVTRVTGILRDITERKNAEETLRHNEQMLRSLTARLDRLREEERTRISREIHDELGQSLTAMKMDLRWLEKRLLLELPSGKVEPLAERILDACTLCDQTITSVQRIAAELRPGVLDRLGLSTALGYEAKRFSQRTGIPCELTLPETATPEDPMISTTVFRIFQEALTNVARHAQAQRVAVAMSINSHRLLLRVSDDGIGIPSEKLRGITSLGLLGMRERAARLGGEVSISNAQPHGTIITIELPISHAS